MPFREVRDLEMHYRAYGEGYPLILVHGLGGNLEGWDPAFVEQLAAGHLVLTPDNRGSGRTTMPDRDFPFSIEDMALDTVGLMDSLGIGRAHVVGHSIGGMIAQSIALERPDKVERLVLCSTSCGGLECIQPERSIVDLLSDRTGPPEEFVCRYVSALFPKWWYDENRDYVDRLTESYIGQVDDRRETARQFMASAEFDACERIGEIRRPTLVLTGAEDQVVPPGNSWLLADRIPGAKLLEIAGAGHGFMNQEPLEAARLILDFLGQES